MNKEQAEREFKRVYTYTIPRIMASKDWPALRQLWNDFTDGLHKSDCITLRQYESWGQPAWIANAGQKPKRYRVCILDDNGNTVSILSTRTGPRCVVDFCRSVAIKRAEEHMENWGRATLIEEV